MVGTIITVVVALVVFGYLVTRPPKTQGRHLVDGPVRIIDGDTIAWSDERVRIRGIDTPELGQHGAIEAKLELKDVLGRGALEVQPIERDVYGRIVARLFVAGADVGAEMVIRGYARASGAYRAQQAQARKAGRGLWGHPHGMPNPAAWRRANPRI